MPWFQRINPSSNLPEAYGGFYNVGGGFFCDFSLANPYPMGAAVTGTVTDFNNPEELDDSTAHFQTDKLVQVGDIVENLDLQTQTVVVAVVSDTALTLGMSLFTNTGQRYRITKLLETGRDANNIVQRNGDDTTLIIGPGGNGLYQIQLDLSIVLADGITGDSAVIRMLSNGAPQCLGSSQHDHNEVFLGEYNTSYSTGILSTGTAGMPLRFYEGDVVTVEIEVGGVAGQLLQQIKNFHMFIKRIDF